MTIEVGEKLPQATFMVMTPDGPAPRTTDEIFAGKKVVLFAVPGAFTPTCHRNHLPGYLDNIATFKAKGVETIAVTGVNDVFVMEAWATASGGAGAIEFLADGSAAFATAIGMAFDASAHGLGTRSNRYAMLVEDGTVATLVVEENNGRAELSSATALLAAMPA